MVRHLLFILTLALTSPHEVRTQFPPPATPRPVPVDAVEVDSLWRHAAALAGDAFEGRGTGTPGGMRAARYIAAELARLGLRPLGADAGFLLPVPMHASRPGNASQLIVHRGASLDTLQLGEDYLLAKTGAQTLVPKPVRMVFVGYGIVAPEHDYNDYQNIDVTDAVVVYLSGEPDSDDDRYFSGRRSTLHSNPEMKQRIAFTRGARGSIMLLHPRDEQSRMWHEWRRDYAFTDVSLPISVPSHLSIVLRFDCAAPLFEDSGIVLDDVVRMDAEHRIRSLPLRAQVSFSGVFDEREFTAPNVVGMLPGTDPLLEDSYLLLSAHYDHLGIGPTVRGDSIYNGLVDNALGTAAVIELARVFSHPVFRPRRSLVFLLTTGEEYGLLGSRFYCAQPPVPLFRTIANVNVDGLAVTDTFDDIVGIGSEYSSLRQHLEQTASDLDLTVSDLPDDVTLLEAFSASDQSAFALAGIPSLLLMEGRAYRNLGPEEGFRRFVEWGSTRYHTPFDDVGQPVNREAIAQHARIIAAFVSRVANTFEEPQWTSGSHFINARLQSLAEER